VNSRSRSYMSSPSVRLSVYRL